LNLAQHVNIYGVAMLAQRAKRIDMNNHQKDILALLPSSGLVCAAA